MAIVLHSNNSTASSELLRSKGCRKEGFSSGWRSRMSSFLPKRGKIAELDPILSSRMARGLPQTAPPPPSGAPSGTWVQSGAAGLCSLLSATDLRWQQCWGHPTAPHTHKVRGLHVTPLQLCAPLPPPMGCFWGCAAQPPPRRCFNHIILLLVFFLGGLFFFFLIKIGWRRKKGYFWEKKKVSSFLPAVLDVVPNLHFSAFQFLLF